MILMWPDFLFLALYFLCVGNTGFGLEIKITKMSHIWAGYIVSSWNFHRLCVLTIHTFWRVDMPDVISGYGIAFDLVDFLWFLQEGSYYSLCRNLKLSQIMRLISTHILICRYVRCDRRLWQGLWFSWFFVVFARRQLLQHT